MMRKRIAQRDQGAFSPRSAIRDPQLRQLPHPAPASASLLFEKDLSAIAGKNQRAVFKQTNCFLARFLAWQSFRFVSLTETCNRASVASWAAGRANESAQFHHRFVEPSRHAQRLQ